MSAIFFLTEVGQPLLVRDFRGDVPLSCIDDFPRLLAAAGDAPCFAANGVHYVHIRHADLIVLCVGRTAHANALAILHFLHRLVAAFAAFVTHVAVESVIDNFVVLYELLDEVFDFGFVQTTDANLLQDYVTQPSYKLEVSQAITALTDAVSWRPPGIYYKKNELFLDVVETVSAQYSTNNEVLSIEVLGAIKLRTFLGGMPRLALGLNNVASVQGMSRQRASRAVVLAGVHFHQCVDLAKWAENQRIEFVPPDGNAELLTYRVQLPTAAPLARRPLFGVDAHLEARQSSRVLISCRLTAQFRKAQQCRYVELLFPVPADCDSPRSQASVGTVLYAPERQRVVWRVPQLSGGASAELQAELLVSGVQRAADLERVLATPILVNFEMPGSAVSGLHVRFLKIDEPTLQYRALPWVRYLSRGDVEVKQRTRTTTTSATASAPASATASTTASTTASAPASATASATASTTASTTASVPASTSTPLTT